MKIRRSFGVAIFLFLSLLLYEKSDLSAAIPKNCLEWFSDSGINSKETSCLDKCKTSNVGMGSFDCPQHCSDLCKSEKGKECADLLDFAGAQVQNHNNCIAFIDIIKEASRRVESYENPARKMMEDLKETFIGEGLTLREGRGKGDCFVGQIYGADGFKDIFKDEWNQVQHAMAGIYIGYRYGILGCIYAMWRETEPQDDELYKVTCPLGRELNDKNFKDLAEKLQKAIGDGSCNNSGN